MLLARVTDVEVIKSSVGLVRNGFGGSIYYVRESPNLKEIFWGEIFSLFLSNIRFLGGEIVRALVWHGECL